MTPIAILYIYASHCPLRLQRAGGRDPFTLTVAHTHLTFPHEGGHDLEMRWHQVRLRLRLRVRLRVRANPNPNPNPNPNQARKLATLVQARARRNPVVMLGDLNGDVEDEAVALLLASGGLTPMSD